MLYFNLQKDVVYQLVDVIYSDVQQLYSDPQTLYDEYYQDCSIIKQVKQNYYASVFYQSPSSLRTWMPAALSTLTDRSVTTIYVELLSIVVLYYSLGCSLYYIKTKCLF